jgi:uncharacterized membrane protein
MAKIGCQSLSFDFGLSNVNPSLQTRFEKNSMSKPPAEQQSVSKSRLEALSDGLFSIVLTLLVFNLIPVISGVENEAELHAAFLKVWPKFVSFVISFIVIGVIWVGHHTYFHAIKGVDEVQLWLNLLVLFCVSLIPFSACLLGEHHRISTAVIIYGLNLVATGLAQNLNWWYASSRKLMYSNIDPHLIRHLKLRRQVFISSSLVGVVVAWFNPEAGFYLYVVNAFFGLVLQLSIKRLAHLTE